LTDNEKKALRDAQEALKNGRPVKLKHRAKKGMKPGGGDPNGIGDDEHDFTLDFSSGLPPKGADE
jgi:hypothetical protein